MQGSMELRFIDSPQNMHMYGFIPHPGHGSYIGNCHVPYFNLIVQIVDLATLATYELPVSPLELNQPVATAPNFSIDGHLSSTTTKQEGRQRQRPI
jgi:hypothetical protein